MCLHKEVADLEKVASMEQIGSLDGYPAEDEGSGAIGDKIPADEDVEGAVLDEIQRKQLKNLLCELVAGLPLEQQQMLKHRYNDEMTRKAAGEKLGVTINQARQIEEKALKNLRYSKRTQLLKMFLEDDEMYSMSIAGTGVQRFNRTWTSSTERAAMRFIELSDTNSDTSKK